MIPLFITERDIVIIIVFISSTGGLTDWRTGQGHYTGAENLSSGKVEKRYEGCDQRNVNAHCP